MATNPHTIVLKGEPIRKEYAAGGTITPGHLIALNSSGVVVVHSSAAGNAQRMFALENMLQGETITDTYTSADQVQCAVCPRGVEIYAILADSQTIAIGDFLESAGDGTLRKHEADSAGVVEAAEPIVAVALEAVDTATDSTATTGRIKVEIV